VEDEGMKITVLGAALIVAAVIGAILLVRYLDNRSRQTKPPQGPLPGQ
jgi:hypothetical protein